MMQFRVMSLMNISCHCCEQRTDGRTTHYHNETMTSHNFSSMFFKKCTLLCGINEILKGITFVINKTPHNVSCREIRLVEFH